MIVKGDLSRIFSPNIENYGSTFRHDLLNAFHFQTRIDKLTTYKQPLGKEVGTSRSRHSRPWTIYIGT